MPCESQEGQKSIPSALSENSTEGFVLFSWSSKSRFLFLGSSPLLPEKVVVNKEEGKGRGRSGRGKERIGGEIKRRLY